LGLKSSLTEYKVDESEAHTITKTATRAESGEVYDQVNKLVKGLW
jgi:hypothetical protein